MLKGEYDYLMRRALWEIVILFVFFCIFHFIFYYGHGILHLQQPKKKKEGRKEVRRSRGKKERKRKINLVHLCQDIWQLRLKFCLRTANYLNIFRTQETKQLKSCRYGYVFT